MLAHSSSSSCSPLEALRYNLSPRRTMHPKKMPTPAPAARASWSRTAVKSLLDLLVAEKAKCNFTQKGLSKEGWRNVSQGMANAGMVYTNKQISNKIGELNRKFRTWKSLQNSTGLGRDPTSGGVVADAEWFETNDDNPEGLQEGQQEGSPDEDPTEPQQMATPPPFLDDMYTLWGSRVKDRGAFMYAGGLDNASQTLPRTPHEDIGFLSAGISSKRSSREQVVTSPKKKRTCNLEEFMQSLSESITATSDREEKCRSREQEEQRELMQILHEDGVPEGSELFLMALYLFQKPVCCAQFKNIKERENRVKYIEWTWRNGK